MSDLFRFLWRESPWALFFSTICTVVSGVFGALLVWLLGEFLQGWESPFSPAGLFFGTCIVYLFTKISAELTLLHLTQNAVLRLRMTLSEKLAAAPVRWLESLGKPALLTVLTKDIDTFVQSFSLVPLLLGHLVMISVCMLYIAYLSISLFLLAAAILLGGVMLFHFAQQRPLAYVRKARQEVDILYGGVASLIEGNRELKLNVGRYRHFMSRVISADAHRFKSAFTKATGAFAVLANVGSVGMYVVIGAVVLLPHSPLGISTGDLTKVTLVLLYLSRPIAEIVSFMPALTQSAVALDRVRHMDKDLPEDRFKPELEDPFSCTNSTVLELDAVVRSASENSDASTFTLGPLNLQFRAGEIVFLIGGNGCGKTTLAMLILGLTDPQAGHIRLNGLDVNGLNLCAYRQYFSPIFSDFHLFERLIATDDQVLKKAEELGLLDLRGRIDLENGKLSASAMSAGQRRRIALAVSLLEDRPIYLFDEWAADQDPLFKKIFYTELLPELRSKGKIVIVITHDDGYFHCADRVVELEDGKIRHYSDIRGCASINRDLVGSSLVNMAKI